MAESEEASAGSKRGVEVKISASGGDSEHLGDFLRNMLFGAADGQTPISRRVRVSISVNLKEASRALLYWTRQGSPLRALLVISVGTITLLASTGFLVFMLFFLVATFNAVIISLLMSLAAAGGFLALFFVFITAIYVGALSVAAFFISTMVTLTAIGVILATGWAGFIWVAWITAKKSMAVTKQSIRYTGSAISAYSSFRAAPHDSSKPANEKHD